MANEKNLKPLNELCSEDAKKIQSKGGKARAKKIEERKQLKEELLLLLANNKMQEKISLALINKALQGDVRAFETIRDTIGEKPIDEKKITENKVELPKMFVTESELDDPIRMKEIMLNAKNYSIELITREEELEADEHIARVIGDNLEWLKS